MKYLGYRLSQLPPVYGLNEFVKFAKFQLAVKSGRLLKDPIWDEYTVEELLIEYYAHQFEDNKDFRLRFQAEINASNSAVDEFSAWADKQMAEEALVRNKIMGAVEEKISFNPADVMGDDA